MMKRILPVLLLTVAAFAMAASAAEEDPKLVKVLEEAKADATKIRGLEFRAEIPVRRITAEDLKEAMLRDLGRVFGGAKQIAHMEALLQHLRVLPEGMGIRKLAEEFFPETVGANYDPLTGRISFLREFPNPRSQKSVMVHELVHALQDQHFDLDSFVDDGREITFDRMLAFGALVEGDAENVQRFFDTSGILAATPIEMIRAFGENQIQSYLKRMAGFPLGVARSFIFQYFDGLLFVETVKRARGGFPAVNRMFRDPPVSTEQVLHPGKYLHRDHPTAILPPDLPEGYEVLVGNVLGELGISIVLKEHLGKAYDPAVAAGWDGDRVLFVRTPGDGRLLAWYTTWDTEADAREFFAAAREMLGQRREGVGRESGDAEVFELVAPDASHGLQRKGKDVLLYEGLPRLDGGGVRAALLKARKLVTTVENIPFGR